MYFQVMFECIKTSLHRFTEVCYLKEWVAMLAGTPVQSTVTNQYL